MPFRISAFIPTLALFLCASAAFAQQPQVQPPQAEPARFAEGRVIVRFRPDVPEATKEQTHASMGARVVKRMRKIRGLHVVELPGGANVRATVERYRRNPNVLYAEPDWIVAGDQTAQNPPNDARYIELWNMHNPGGTVLGNASVPADVDVDAPEAWSVTTGSSSVIVGTLDSGIDYRHPDLAANVYRNEAECVVNGVDDDGNGYRDDCHGIDTFNHDSDPIDDQGHGTHVAGTIGAIGDNGIGVAGMTWQVKIIACKFLGTENVGQISGAVECMDYFAGLRDDGIDVLAINNSWGGTVFSQALKDAAEELWRRGVLLPSAAMNSAHDIDGQLIHPAGLNFPNIISTAAITMYDQVADYSNYGQHAVHLAAPGSQVLSTTPDNTYKFFNGTSMATPLVTGLAALLRANDPSLDWKEIRNLILASGDSKAYLASKTATGKRLNAYRALTCTSAPVMTHLQPESDNIIVFPGKAVDFAVLNVNCAQPAGGFNLALNNGGVLAMTDGGTNGDQEANDGVYTGRWTPSTPGQYTLTLPNGHRIQAEVADCTLNTAPNTITICTPAANATVTNPVKILAHVNASSTPLSMTIWSNGSQLLSKEATDTISGAFTFPSGAQHYLVEAVLANGTTVQKRVDFTITGSAPPCPPGNSDPSVTICNLSIGEHVETPVRLQVGTHSTVGITQLRVLAGGVEVHRTTASHLDAAIPMPVGTKDIRVEATDTQGKVAANSVRVRIAPCDVGVTSPSVTICAPASGATVTSPVRIAAGTRSNSEVRDLRILVNGVEKHRVADSAVDTSLALSAGSQTITVRGTNLAGQTFSKSVTVTVSGSGTTPPCTLSTTNPSVTICQPADGATVSSPVRVVAGSTSTSRVHTMQIYLDGVRKYQVSAGTLDTSLPMTAGTHRLTVQAYNEAGQVFKKSVNITVSDSPGACEPPTASPAVKICEPADGATVTSPIRLRALTNSSSQVTLMQVYVDGQKKHEDDVSQLDISLPLATGTRKVTVQATNSAGQIFKHTIFVNVSGASGGCTPGGTDPSVTFCAPANGATVASPVRIVAATTSSSPVTMMQIYVDGVKKYQVAAAQIDTSLAMAAGTRRVTVQAQNQAGQIFKTTHNITVSGP